MSAAERLREALAAAQHAKGRFDDLEAKLSEATAERDAADAEAERASAAFKTEIGARAAGEPSNVEAAKKAKDRAVAHLDELVLVVDAIEAKRDELERHATGATRAVALARVDAAVALSEAAERRVREAAVAFAAAQGARFRLAHTAALAYREANGSPVEPIPFTGHGPALLMTDHDDGLFGIFRREGVNTGLQPHGVPVPITDADLIAGKVR